MLSKKTPSEFFITSQFSYPLVVLIFYNQKLGNHINPIHKRALRIEYRDHNSTFAELFSKDNSFKIHEQNSQNLLIEIFKVNAEPAVKIMNDVFDIIECPYLLRNELRFKHQNIRTVRLELKQLLELAPGCGTICPVI